MNIIIFLYTEVLWRPLFNGLVILHAMLPGQDLGLAIIALTVGIRLVLAPLLWKSQRAQQKLAALQPELTRVQERHKGNREAQGKAVMEFYAANRVNPFGGCAPLLVQFPILITLFQIFRTGINADSLRFLYPFVADPGAVSSVGLFGLLDLAQGSIALGAVAALTQYLQTRFAAPPVSPPTGSGSGDFSKMLQWQALYFFPLIILFWSRSLPSALTLHWTVMNVSGIMEQIIMRKISKYGYGDDKK